LRHAYARIIRCGPSQLTDFPPANGWSSIISKWSSTFFIATNAPSTAWKVCGAMRRCCSRNQFSRSDGFPAVTSEINGCPSRRSLSVASVATSWLGPVTAEAEPSEHPEHPENLVAQVLEAVSHPAIRPQKSGSSSDRCPGPLHARRTRGSRE
jgi:hypothetical protein